MAEMSEKLTMKLQQMVCTLEVHAAFSMEWTEQVDRLEKLAKVIDKESRIEKASEQQTLWDGEELILRTLVVSIGTSETSLRNHFTLCI